MTELNTIPLSMLRFGSEMPPKLRKGALAVLNMRKGPAAPDPVLRKQLLAAGVVVPLVVVRAPNMQDCFVVDGQRRLIELRAIEATGGPPEGSPLNLNAIQVTICDNAIQPLALSVLANEHLPPHPVDRYEAFAALVASKWKPADIAARFGLRPYQVDQALALGALAEPVRESWRAGEIDAETAQAFTIGEPEDQERILKRLRKQGDWALSPDRVREALGANKNDAARLVNFIGTTAYEAAGGRITRDLFGDDHVVHDPALAKRLADAKLDLVVQQITGEGWAWAAAKTALPDYASHAWQRLTPSGTPAPRPEVVSDTDEDAAEQTRARQAAAELESFGPAQRKKSGVILEILPNGAVLARGGYVKPDDKKAAAAKKAKKTKAGAATGTSDEPEARGMPSSLAHTTSEQITRAASVAIAQEPDVALRAIAAAMASGGNSPVSVRVAGLGRGNGGMSPGEEDFAKVLARLGGQSDVAVLKYLATWVATALDLGAYQADQLPLADAHSDGATLLNALDPKLLNLALLSQWDAPGYFKSMPRAAAEAALLECGDKTKADKLKKGELAEHAAKIAQSAKWLPPEMRTAHYDGPGNAGRSRKGR